MFAVLHLFLVLFGLLGLNELCRRYKWPTVIIFFILPLALIPVYLSSGIGHWFRWIKLYSVVFACVWYTLFRYTKLSEKKWARFIVAAILAINIAEAVTQDFTQHQLWNILNAIAGILNILTLSGWRDIQPDTTCKERDMIWPEMTMFWIIAYDVWNWCFVYLNFPEHAGYHLMVLLACTIPAFFKRTLWLQARAFTLAGWMMYFFTFTAFIDAPGSYVMLPRNEITMTLVALLSFGLNVVYAYKLFGKKLSKKMQLTK